MKTPTSDPWLRAVERSMLEEQREREAKELADLANVAWLSGRLTLARELFRRAERVLLQWIEDPDVTNV